MQSEQCKSLFRFALFTLHFHFTIHRRPTMLNKLLRLVSRQEKGIVIYTQPT